MTKGYPSYRASGIAWMPKIPAHWETVPLKRSFRILSGATPRSSIAEYWDGDIVWITPADYKTQDKYIRKGARNITPEGYSSCSTNMIPRGSIIFSKRAPIGTVAINDVELCTNQGCLSCIPLKNVPATYYYYLLSAFTDIFEAHASGSTFKEISATTFGNIKLPIPPREEQEQIVRFLDWKVSAIDKLIATYKKEITCLEELSQAQIDTTISHLASNPSILKKLKRITACNRSTLDESTPYDYLFRYVDISSVDAKHGITHYEKTVFGKSPSRARRIVHKDDLIVSTVRTYLRAIAKIEDDDNVIVSTGFAVITPQNVDSGYLECLFKSNLFCDEVVRRSIGVSYPSINTSALMDISVPIPSFDTQIDIGKRLTAQRKKINRYIEYKKQQISNLNELKTRLISDAVTGKIDVRSIKLPNFAKEE